MLFERPCTHWQHVYHKSSRHAWIASVAHGPHQRARTYLHPRSWQFKVGVKTRSIDSTCEHASQCKPCSKNTMMQNTMMQGPWPNQLASRSHPGRNTCATTVCCAMSTTRIMQRFPHSTQDTSCEPHAVREQQQSTPAINSCNPRRRSHTWSTAAPCRTVHNAGSRQHSHSKQKWDKQW